MHEYRFATPSIIPVLTGGNRFLYAVYCRLENKENVFPGKIRIVKVLC
jgi:hypothetical protein